MATYANVCNIDLQIALSFRLVNIVHDSVILHLPSMANIHAS